MFAPLFFSPISLIQLCDKKNLTFADSWDEILLNSSWKMLLSSPKARLITFSKTRLIKILSQQLTHDRSYISLIVDHCLDDGYVGKPPVTWYQSIN